MTTRECFVDLALAGEIADPDDAVDQYICDWHESDSTLELHEWLGFTQEEYKQFVERPGSLKAILQARTSPRVRMEFKVIPVTKREAEMLTLGNCFLPGQRPPRKSLWERIRRFLS